MHVFPPERPSSWTETLAGVFIFIEFPLFNFLRIFLYPIIPGQGAYNELINLAGAILFLSLWLLIPLAGFAIGWLKGFPRWVYPWVAFSLFVSLYLTNVTTPGISLFGVPIFGQESWGLRACVPGLLMAALVLVLTRSFRSLLVFFENGWKDSTRFTYGLFGLMPLLNWIAFDEISSSYQLPFQVGLIIITTLAAVAYLRSTSPTKRVLSLVAGFGLCVLIDTIAPALYWQENGWVDVAGMLRATAIFLLIVFLPVLIGLFSHLTKSARRQTQ